MMEFFSLMRNDRAIPDRWYIGLRFFLSRPAQEQATPAARQGRKATDLLKIAGLPLYNNKAALYLPDFL